MVPQSVSSTATCTKQRNLSTTGASQLALQKHSTLSAPHNKALREELYPPSRSAGNVKLSTEEGTLCCVSLSENAQERTNSNHQRKVMLYLDGPPMVHVGGSEVKDAINSKPQAHGLSPCVCQKGGRIAHYQVGYQADWSSRCLAPLHFLQLTQSTHIWP